MNIKTLTIHLPSNLNLEKLLNDNPPNFYENGKYEIDYFKYILHLITYLPSKSREKKGDNEVPYTRINTIILRGAISRFHLYIRYLLEHKILEYDSKNKYAVGKHSKGYKFAEFYNNAEFVKDSIKHKRLLKRVFEWYNLQNKRTEIPIYLAKWFNEEFAIDEENTLNFIDTLKYKRNAEYNKALHKQSVQKILDKQYHFSVDNKGYRFHTVLTNLKGELRNYLTYSGEELLSIDLSNSQPFFVTVLLNPYFYINNSSRKILSIYELPDYETIINNTPFEIIKTSIFQSDNELQNEINTFTYWVKTNTFYKEFAKALNLIPQNTESELDTRTKQRVKDIFYSVSFSDENDSKITWEEDIKKKNRLNAIARLNQIRKQHFAKIFPKIFEVLNLYKSINYKLLSWLLQRIEAEIFVRRVPKLFAEEFPDAPIFTLHDSVITTHKYESNLVEILAKEIYNATDYYPNLVAENWNETNPHKRVVFNYFKNILPHRAIAI